MRKFFGQKSKQRSLTATSLNMPLVPLTKDDKKSIMNSAPSSTETTDSGERSKKLFVVVSGRSFDLGDKPIFIYFSFRC
jgi:hypothetical protein